MVQRSGGFRRKSRSKLRKNVAERGKLRIRNFLQTFKTGDRVTLVAEPSIQSGMHHPRFQGRTGTITAKQGNCYKILIKTGNKIKNFIVHPVHLRRVK